MDEWRCGLCGQGAPDCCCGDPLMLIIRIPDLTADIDEHDLAARSMVEMINAQRHENWVCGGGDPDDERDVRLMASGWADASGFAEAERNEDAAMLSAFIADVVAERDRLRAVVDAVRELRTHYDQHQLLDTDPDAGVAAATQAAIVWETVTARLDDLEATDG
jgi:hypothetical protein